MTANTFKLSTLGLDHRDDMIVRLMLSVVEGKTRATWRRVDSFDADLLFCSPASALAAAAVRRAADTGRPVCVSLLAAGQTALPGTRGVSTKLRVDSFIALLDEVSDSLLGADPAATMAAPAPHIAPAKPASAAVPAPRALPAIAAATPIPPPVAPAGQGPEIAGLACALHEVMADRIGSAWRIDIGQTSLIVLTAEKRYLSRETLTPATLAMLSRLELDLRLERLATDDPVLDRVRAEGQPLHELLWGCGLGSPNDRLLPWLREGAPIRLRDWPAFRRDDCVPAHTGFAALLTWSAHTIESIVELTGRSAGEVRAFVNACALCGLVLPAAQPEPTVRLGPSPRPRRTTPLGLSLSAAPRAAALMPLAAAAGGQRA